jgi:hypothetical protein
MSVHRADRSADVSKQKKRERTKKKATRALVNALTETMDPAEKKLFKALPGEPDLGLMLKLAVIDLRRLSDSYLKGLIKASTYARARLSYFDTVRRLALAIDKIGRDSVDTITVNIGSLLDTEGFFANSDGTLIDPEELEAAEELLN